MKLEIILENLSSWLKNNEVNSTAKKVEIFIPSKENFLKIHNKMLKELKINSFPFDGNSFSLKTSCNMQIEFKTCDNKEVSNKKIYGYKCPIDMFYGKVRKGCTFKDNGDNFYYPLHGIGLANDIAPIMCKLPKELVETWEPVYEDRTIERVKIYDIESRITAEIDSNGIYFPYKCIELNKDTLLELRKSLITKVNIKYINNDIMCHNIVDYFSFSNPIKNVMKIGFSELKRIVDIYFDKYNRV